MNDIWHNILGQFSIQYSYIQITEKIIRTITNSKNRNLCRNLLNNLNIFTFISQYVFSLLSFVITSRKQNITNSYIHGRNTRYGSDNQQTISNLPLHQRGSYRMGLKVFNSLSTYIKDISSYVKELKKNLKNFLFSNSFYMLEEYFQYNNI
jgi:hypothetical protein